MFVEKFNVSKNIEKGRRIVDFAKAGRICGSSQVSSLQPAAWAAASSFAASLRGRRE
jgi:hypothetical protein